MKKIISLILSIVMMTMLTACSGNSKVVKENINGNTWFFNGGSDLTLNRITFSENEAEIAQIEGTGNGVVITAKNTYKYSVKEDHIAITLADGSSLEIPFSLEEDVFELGGKDYKTPSEVAKELDGVWKYRDNSKLFGMSMKSEHNVKISGNTITYEHASEALGYPGEYYYYGPEKGKVEITSAGLDTDIDSMPEFGFNIINGKAVLIRYTDVFSPSSGSLPGRYGYRF